MRLAGARTVVSHRVAALLIRLLDKDLVRRETQGRGHVYWPVRDAASTAADRMRAALDARPERRAVLQQFAAGLDAADAEVLRSLLNERKP